MAPITPENDVVAVGRDKSGNCIVATFTPSFTFTIDAAAISRAVRQQALLMDTDLGAIQLTIDVMERRHIEDLAISRAKNTGHVEQFRQIASALKNAGMERDDSRLRLGHKK